MPDPAQPRPFPPAPELHGLDPGDLLARALQSARAAPDARTWTPPTPEELAALLPQYRIECLLGHGGMGAVYKGAQAALDRPVAIKLLPAELAADADFVARFQREARTLARLQHSGIVAVHDFGQTEVAGPTKEAGGRASSAGHLYFVMEYVDGTDLQRVLKEPGLKPEQAFEVIAQICDALQYAHRQGVIHRDIKPANILLTRDGRAKVADFGLARPLAEDGGGLTLTHLVMGTPAYMAPEQHGDAAHTDHRADIFAVGVMFYEMLTGQRPMGAFPPPSHRVQVDVRIDEVVLKALQQEPDRRYQQAGEMKTDVDRIRTTPPPRHQPPPPAKRKVPARAVGFVTVLALAGTAGWLLWKNGNRNAPMPPDEANAIPAMATGPTKAVPLAASIAAATTDLPWENSLGMRFVPVPIIYPQDYPPDFVPALSARPTGGKRVLFSIWETRVQDFAVFVQQTRYEWQKPSFAQAPTHPVVNMSWDDAQHFCQWLTERERKAGALGVHDRYRLPHDHEWSCAVGIGELEDLGKSPGQKARNVTDIFPWGTAWPPPPGAGNYADATARDHHIKGKEDYLPSSDGYAWTAPVGRFAANRFGLFDLGGNAHEYSEDQNRPESPNRTGRGGSYSMAARELLLASDRSNDAPAKRILDRGFRCVLESAAPIGAPASISK